MPTRDVCTSHDRRPHILVIDDAPELLDLFVALLEGEGYRVTTSHVLLTVDEISAIAPDVIVHDLIFAGDGHASQSLPQTRQDPRLASVPLILCTADSPAVSDRDAAARLAMLGAPVILKRFAIEALLEMLAEALSRPAPKAQTSLGASHQSLEQGTRPVIDWCAS